ncbi:ATP-binding cassette domain-containing protein [Actinobaculum sp. 352]|uniref:ATP-binding cassette domain-containing protein n=1 Tax=Actinobaculum sp. 352 TaxID=2490946 RepID=UPI0013DFED9C|nr:ATP-binding cassette domain-containing protein [Actinobaculum sp. 352]
MSEDSQAVGPQELTGAAAPGAAGAQQPADAYGVVELPTEERAIEVPLTEVAAESDSVRVPPAYAAGPSPAFAVHGLCQGYGKREVLHDLGFDVPGNGTTGLLGPNGAGKTTLLRTLVTLLKPRAGELRSGGVAIDSRAAIREFRRKLGYLPQGFSYDEAFSALDFVSYALWMREYPSARIADEARNALARVDLADRASSRMRELSGGMRQRVGIAAAIAGEPSLIVLDEPTAGLDPGQRFELRAVLSDVAARSTIILSTHLIEDLAAIADHLIVLNEGRISYEGTAEMLRAKESLSVEGLEAVYRRLLNGDYAR